MDVTGWMIDTLGNYKIMIGGVIISIGLLTLFRKWSRGVEEERESRSSSEDSHLMKSESCSSSASAFADDSTEVYINKLKYDSMNKYVKDW